MTSKETILKAIDLPAVPMVAAKVIQLIDDPKTSFNDLQKAIMADQAMASRILKIANSSFYGVRQNVDTISEALSILGLKVARLIVLAAATRGIYKRFGAIEQKLWEHSLGVSIAAGIVSTEVSHVRREEAVVAGLLHDVGKVAINNSLPDKFIEIIKNIDETKMSSVNVEQEILGFNHTEAGYFLAEKWGFPDTLCEVILKHHSADSINIEYVDIYRVLLCSTIALSDAICVRLGIGYIKPMPEIDLGIEKWLKILKLSEDGLDKIITIFKERYVIEKMAY